MDPAPRILVVAATRRELASPGDWMGMLCGVGPVEAAVATTRGLAEHRPDAVVHVGIAGARRRAALPAGALVVGTHSLYCDLGELPADWAVRDIAVASDLVGGVAAALPGARRLSIGTSARVGGTVAESGCDVEAMEGFGVLRAAQAAGIPAIEVRAISNEIEEHDRTRWQFAVAFDAITTATPLIVNAVGSVLRQRAAEAQVRHHA